MAKKLVTKSTSFNETVNIEKQQIKRIRNAIYRNKKKGYLVPNEITQMLSNRITQHYENIENINGELVKFSPTTGEIFDKANASDVQRVRFLQSITPEMLRQVSLKIDEEGFGIEPQKSIDWFYTGDIKSGKIDYNKDEQRSFEYGASNIERVYSRGEYNGSEYIRTPAEPEDMNVGRTNYDQVMDWIMAIPDVHYARVEKGRNGWQPIPTGEYRETLRSLLNELYGNLGDGIESYLDPYMEEIDSELGDVYGDSDGYEVAGSYNKVFSILNQGAMTAEQQEMASNMSEMGGVEAL